MVRVVELASNPHILPSYFALLEDAGKRLAHCILITVRRRAVYMPGMQKRLPPRREEIVDVVRPAKRQRHTQHMQSKNQLVTSDSRRPASVIPVACPQSHLDSVLNLAGLASPGTQTKQRDLLAIAQGSGWVLYCAVLVRSHVVLLCVDGRCRRV